MQTKNSSQCKTGLLLTVNNYLPDQNVDLFTYCEATACERHIHTAIRVRTVEVVHRLELNIHVTGANHYIAYISVLSNRAK